MCMEGVARGTARCGGDGAAESTASLTLMKSRDGSAVERNACRRNEFAKAKCCGGGGGGLKDRDKQTDNY